MTRSARVLPALILGLFGLSACTSSAGTPHRLAAFPESTPPEKRIVLLAPRFNLRDDFFGKREAWNETAQRLAADEFAASLGAEGLALILVEEDAAGFAACAEAARESQACADAVRAGTGADHALLLDVSGSHDSAAATAATAVAVPAAIYAGVIIGFGAVLTLPIWGPLVWLDSKLGEEEAASAPSQPPTAAAPPPTPPPPPGAVLQLEDLRTASVVWSNRIDASDWRNAGAVHLSVEGLLQGFPLWP
jgi:hypothetical protein